MQMCVKKLNKLEKYSDKSKICKICTYMETANCVIFMHENYF